MTISTQVIVASWAVFLVYWAVSAMNVKKDIRPGGAWWSGRGYLLRFAVLALIIWFAAYRSLAPRVIFSGVMGIHPAPGPVAMIGAALTALGVAFAVWARSHLGRNWSSHPALKEGHELVTSGPYRFVRHPIYTGILFAMIGSALAISPVWFGVTVFAGVVFGMRIRKEEGIMMRQFPEEYREYKKRTKALIPFIW